MIWELRQLGFRLLSDQRPWFESSDHSDDAEQSSTVKSSATEACGGSPLHSSVPADTLVCLGRGPDDAELPIDGAYCRANGAHLSPEPGRSEGGAGSGDDIGP